MFLQNGRVIAGLRSRLPIPDAVTLNRLWEIQDSALSVDALVECLASDAALTLRALAGMQADMQIGSFAQLGQAMDADDLTQIATEASLDFLSAPPHEDWPLIQAHLHQKHRQCSALASWFAAERGEATAEVAAFAGLVSGLEPWLTFTASPQVYIDGLEPETGRQEDTASTPAVDSARWRRQLAELPLSATVLTALAHCCDNWTALSDAPALVRYVRAAIALTDDPACAGDIAREMQVDRGRLSSAVADAVRSSEAASRSADWKVRRALATRLANVLLHRSGSSIEATLQQLASQLPGCAGIRVLTTRGSSELVPGVISDPQLSSMVVNWQRGSSCVAQAMREHSAVQSLTRESPWRYVAASAVDTQLCYAMQVPGILCVPLVDDVDAGQKQIIVLGMDAAGIADLAAEPESLDRFVGLARELLGRREEEQDYAEKRIREAVHEARNPLTAINNVLFLLQERHTGSREEAGLLELIQKELGHLQRTIERLAEPETDTREDAANLRDMIESLIRLWRESYKGDQASLNIELDIPGGLPKFVIDVAKLRQALINLIKNAAEAQPKGGRITVSLRDNVNVDGDEMFRISVMDTGPGLPEHVRDSLYQSVGSQKRPGQSGVGLVIVRRLVQELGGHLYCETGDRKGTKFSILLPRRVDPNGQNDVLPPVSLLRGNLDD